MWHTLILPLVSAICLMNSAHYLGINSSFNFLRKGYFQLFRALVFKLFWLCIPMGKIGKHEKIYTSYLHMKVMINLDSILKSRDIILSTKVHLVKAMVFPVVMYGCELDYKESWTLKNWRFWAVVLEKTLESPLDCKEIQPVHPKGDQSWVFIGGTDAEAEAPILWPPHVESWLIGKDPDAGRDWGQEEKGTTEDEMAGWHHRLDERESEWTLGDGDGQGGLACCSSWHRKESDTTEGLNWTVV